MTRECRTGRVIWFTGLFASGKSTFAIKLEAALNELGFSTVMLNGDLLRNGLNKDLGYSLEDRAENLRRAA
jgi:adenylylsulfate kinase-like enzyme